MASCTTDFLCTLTRECRCLYKGTVIFPQLCFLKDPECGSSGGLIQQLLFSRPALIHIEIIACEQALLRVQAIELTAHIRKNLKTDQRIFLQVIILSILITFSHVFVFILLGENWYWSLLGLKGLNTYACVVEELVDSNRLRVHITFEFLTTWIHWVLGKKCLVDDDKRMLNKEAVPVNTRRPLLRGAWSEVETISIKK